MPIIIGAICPPLFAPEGNYASNSDDRKNSWNGTDGRQVKEFKEVIKSLHKAGIAVILDVVYNHVSQYDFHPLKHMDKEQYFRQDQNGGYSSVSGCGNDLKTENDYIQKMIINSVKYWMAEYHIDGFRFDLGHLIDWDTVSKIKFEAEKINPNVFITCEPWGGGYDQIDFLIRDGLHGMTNFGMLLRDGIQMGMVVLFLVNGIKIMDSITLNECLWALLALMVVSIMMSLIQ